MGCGGSTRAVAPHDVRSGVVPDSGFSSIVPESAPSTTGRAWEEADKAPSDARLPDRQKDADEEEKEQEQQQPEILRKEVEAIRLSANDSGMHPQDQPEMRGDERQQRPFQHRANGRPQAALEEPAANTTGQIRGDGRREWPFKPRADTRPQSSLGEPPANIQDQAGKKNEGDPPRMKRIHTNRGLSDVIENKPDLILNDNIVPEPLNLQDYNSFRYTPTKEHFAEGHPLAPCLPSHERHVKKVRKSLTHFAKFPDRFKDLVNERRGKMKTRSGMQVFKAEA